MNNIHANPLVDGYRQLHADYTGVIQDGIITSIIFHDGVTSIGVEAFRDFSGLTEVIIPDGVVSIGDAAFLGCTRLTAITIPNSVTSIGWGAFMDCSRLTEVTIPNSVTSIGEGVFFSCPRLTTVTIPNSVTSIGASAFLGCVRLTGVIIPDSVTSIGASAFRDCSNLTAITIPDSVTSIGDRAFLGCVKLTTIRVFYGLSMDNVGLRDNVEVIRKGLLLMPKLPISVYKSLRLDSENFEFRVSSNLTRFIYLCFNRIKNKKFEEKSRELPALPVELVNIVLSFLIAAVVSPRREPVSSESILSPSGRIDSEATVGIVSLYRGMEGQDFTVGL